MLVTDEAWRTGHRTATYDIVLVMFLQTNMDEGVKLGSLVAREAFIVESQPVKLEYIFRIQLAEITCTVSFVLYLPVLNKDNTNVSNPSVVMPVEIFGLHFFAFLAICDLTLNVSESAHCPHRYRHFQQSGRTINQE